MEPADCYLAGVSLPFVFCLYSCSISLVDILSIAYRNWEFTYFVVLVAVKRYARASKAASTARPADVIA